MFWLYILRWARGIFLVYIFEPYIFYPPPAEFFWVIYFQYIFWHVFSKNLYEFLCILRRCPKKVGFWGSQPAKVWLIYSLYILRWASGIFLAYIFWFQEFSKKKCTIYSIYNSTPRICYSNNHLIRERTVWASPISIYLRNVLTLAINREQRLVHLSSLVHWHIYVKHTKIIAMFRSISGFPNTTIICLRFAWGVATYLKHKWSLIHIILQKWHE